MRDLVDRPQSAALKKSWIGCVSLATFWAALNCVYVYLVLHGHESYRIESAVFILVFFLVPLTVGGRRHEPRAARLSPSARRVLLVTAIGLWLAVVAPLLKYPFLSDDYVFLRLYGTFADVMQSPQFFRPAFAATFLTLARLGGGSPVPFHAASFLLHFLAASLVYGLARRLFAASLPAVICFAVFLLNPLQLEAVLWPSGLQELLWTVFLLAALRCYIGSQTLTVHRLIGTLALVGCALLSKETAVSFVLLLPAADWVFFRMNRGRLLAATYAAFGVALATYLLVRRHFASIESSFYVVPSRYFVKQFLSIPYKAFAQPWNASAVHVSVLVQCLVALLIVGSLFFVVVVRGTSGRLLAGPALILFTTLPVYSYFFVGPDLAGSRYIYFGSIGWVLLLTDLLSSTVQRRLTMSSVIVAIVVYSFVLLKLNLRPWQTAGELVNTLRAGLEQGQTADTIIARWQATTGVAVELANGIPYTYEGVGIFINGYPEFLHRVRDR